MTQDKSLDGAYSLQTPDDNRRLYADWAETYDTDFVASHGYVFHEAVANAFQAAGGTGPVLDLGAGTGVVGEALARLGIAPVDGTDISPEMLARAGTKKVYRRLFEGDILAGLDTDDGTYPGIVSAGTFTLGHVGPEGLDEVVRLLAPGGLAVIGVRDLHFDQAGFSARLARLEPVLAGIERPLVRIYADGSTGDHADDMAYILHLWKA